jgi:hypothetical protein
MSSHPFDYLDGNAAAGELSNIFALDVTAAEGQCAHCGATKPFAEARVYVRGSRPRGAVRRLRARTPSSSKCSPAPAPRCAWHDIFEPQRITKAGVRLNGPYPEWLHWRRLEILHGWTRSGDPQVFRAGSLAISRHGGLRRRPPRDESSCVHRAKSCRSRRCWESHWRANPAAS